MAGTNYFVEVINSDGNTEYIAFTDRNNLPTMVRGTTVPTTGEYAKGCIFVKTDATDGTRSVYENKGTTTTPSFKLVGLNYEAKTVTVLAGATSGTATVVSGDIVLGYSPTAQDQMVKSIAVSGTTLTVTLAAAATANNTFSVVLLKA